MNSIFMLVFGATLVSSIVGLQLGYMWGRDSVGQECKRLGRFFHKGDHYHIMLVNGEAVRRGEN